MTYKIEQTMKSGTITTKFGEMDKYLLKLEGTNDNVEMLQKAGTPAPSGEIIGTIEDTQYGKRFKKERTGGYGGFSKSDPETSKQIIRQNSLTNAVNYCVAKANLMDKKDGLKWLSGKEVIQVATYFAKYSEGLVTVVTESKPTAVKQVVTADDEDPADPNSDPKDDEVNLDDIPFD